MFRTRKGYLCDTPGAQRTPKKYTFKKIGIQKNTKQVDYWTPNRCSKEHQTDVLKNTKGVHYWTPNRCSKEYQTGRLLNKGVLGVYY